jgi:hypothetical protein
MTKEHQTSTSNPSSFEPQWVGTQRQQLKFDYRIRHTDEVHERIASERELSIAQDVATTAEIIEYMAIVLDPGPVGEGWRVRIYPPGTIRRCLNTLRTWRKTPRRQLLKRQRRSSMHTAAQFENGCWLADELQDRIGGRLQVVDEDGACVKRAIEGIGA